MEDMQKQIDLAFAELDVIEEMLRTLVAAQNLHRREDFGVRLPVTQTREFQLLGRFLEQARWAVAKADCFVDWPGGFSAPLPRF